MKARNPRRIKAIAPSIGARPMVLTAKVTEESTAQRTARLWESLEFWLNRAQAAVEVTAVDEAIEYSQKAEEIALTLRKHLRGH